MACCKKSFPGAGADLGQGQALLATEPGQAREKLTFAARRRLPATERMKVFCRRHPQFGSYGATQYNAIQPRNGQARQADGDLVARANIQGLPALQGACADAFDLPVIECHRCQLQQWGDAPGPADLEMHLAHFGQGLGEGVFPGGDPIRRFGLPAFGRRALFLTQDDAITGKGQGRAVPVITPALGVGKTIDRLAVGGGIREAQRIQGRMAGEQYRGPLWPVPDKQADTRRLSGIQHLAGHQAGHRGAGVEAAGLSLYVVGQAPVEFALHQQIPWLRQLSGNGRDLARRGRPVLATYAVAATDGLYQQAIAIHQGDRHAVDFGLNPDIGAAAQPMLDGAGVAQFFQASVHDGVGNRAARGAQWFCGRTELEALAPFGKACPGLVIQLIGDQRATLAVIVIVPGFDLFLQGGDFDQGPFSRPVGALLCMGVQAGENEQAGERQSQVAEHRERPCSWGCLKARSLMMGARSGSFAGYFCGQCRPLPGQACSHRVR